MHVYALSLMDQLGIEDRLPQRSFNMVDLNVQLVPSPFPHLHIQQLHILVRYLDTTPPEGHYGTKQ
jgi:hypothetical protein